MAEESPISPANAQRELAALRSPRILVVDDEQDFVTTLTMLLRVAGYEVRGVHNATEVREAIFDFAPDVVLLDIAMPRMTGYDVARSLREQYGSARPALVAVTGRVRNSDKLLAQLAGFDHHVAKPYQPAALLALLESILTRRGAPPAA